jgi:hypothetical protein
MTLPPLPGAAYPVGTGSSFSDYYTRQQMRDYALMALAEFKASLKPVAYGIHSLRDGSWSNEVAVCRWTSFERQLASLESHNWVVNKAAEIAPLYDLLQKDDQP